MPEDKCTCSGFTLQYEGKCCCGYVGKKYRYYITDTFEGCIKGTNDAELAKVLAGCEGYFVVDTYTGKWLTQDSPIAVMECKNTE